MKNTVFLIIFLIINNYDSFSQYLKPEKSTIACNKKFILVIAEEMPKLQISIDTLEYFLNQKIKLSNEQINLEVNMDIGFIINCKGEVGDYHLIRTNNDELFNPIIKLLQGKCEWKPGKQKNHDIDMYYSFNVTLSRGKLKLKAQNYRY